MKIRKLFAALSLIALPLIAEVPEPYKSIRDLPFDSQGFFQNRAALLALLQSRHIKTVIEVGSWLGESTRYIASNIPEGSVVYAVDTWLGSQNEVLHLDDPRLPHLYQLFLSNIKHAQLCHKIIPVRMDSIEASKALNVMADLIYIDAAHDTESVYNDILSWHMHLKPGGIMCGDDWDWNSVKEAVYQTASILGKRVRNDGNNCWWFE